MALDAGAAAVIEQLGDVGGGRAVDDGGDRGAHVGVGDDRAVEREHALPLRGLRQHRDLLDQRVAVEAAAAERAQRRERAADVGERRAQHRDQRRAAADDGEGGGIEELGERDHVGGCSARGGPSGVLLLKVTLRSRP